eukprot:CAMPEP_0178900666 /NCGR_PEP_ID=MMETSP0786-20121207/3592_1 /TAXON_ID=186022 /ORGANISM="Thalassionema frauenfeldii, Strain CCMP 1798" /LENGTH=483 /DNA_ID=CAMNT_0020571679 /DNA_START=510 /DNA_END=1961 /DNA_ORIENTATION=+
MPPSIQIHNSTTPVSSSTTFKPQHRQRVVRKSSIQDDNQSDTSSSTSTTATNSTSHAPQKRVQQQHRRPQSQRPNLIRPKSMPALNQNAVQPNARRQQQQQERLTVGTINANMQRRHSIQDLKNHAGTPATRPTKSTREASSKAPPTQMERRNSVQVGQLSRTNSKVPKNIASPRQNMERRHSIQVGHLTRPVARRPVAATLKQKSRSVNDLSKLLSSSGDLPAPKNLASIHKAFPTAIPIKEMVGHVTATLANHGYGSSTLLSTSLCCDEINRDLEHEFEEHFGNHFAMGGLAGFPFGGITSFNAMAHHIPDGGSCLLVYGPHVGIDRSGKFGTVERRGRLKSGSCCGSATIAAAYCCAVHAGTQKLDIFSVEEDIDIEQHFVGQMLLPHAKRLDEADWPEVELPRILYEEQQKQIYKIVQQCCREVAGNGKIALLGGIQINTPCEQEDYFVPLDFELRTNQDGTIMNKFEEAFSDEAEIMA